MHNINVNTHATALNEIAYLFAGHCYGEDRRDMTVVLDREDALEFYKHIDTSKYEQASVDFEGVLFFVTSSVENSHFFVESVYSSNSTIKHHETDILIYPHYVPAEVQAKNVDGASVVIGIDIESTYDKLTDIIRNN